MMAGLLSAKLAVKGEATGAGKTLKALAIAPSESSACF